MPVQPSGERAVWTRHDDSLAAACFKCRWTASSEKALALAEAEKLTCWKCGSPAVVAYIPSQVQCGGVEASLPAGVHEEMASSQTPIIINPYDRWLEERRKEKEQGK